MGRTTDALVTRIAAPLLARAASAGAVLCFHSLVTAARPSASDVHVALTALADVADAVARAYRWVPLRELVQRHRAGRSTAGLVALSFDDAYAALLDGLPPLGVPATVFVVSAAAVSGARFWWDRVDEVAARLAPDEWRLFEEACGVPAGFREGQPAEFGPLRPLRQWILAQHRGRWPAQLEATLAEWETRSGAAVHHRPMTQTELVALRRASVGIEMGVHTVTHPVLPLLDDAALEAEIRDCQDALTDLLGACVPILAAPFGLYDERTVQIARRCGIEATLTLGGTTLAAARSADAIPRFCQTRDVPLWRMLLQVSGLAERARRWFRPPPPLYPALPSATS